MLNCKRIDVWLMERCQTNGVTSDMGEMLPCAKTIIRLMERHIRLWSKKKKEKRQVSGRQRC